MKIPANIIEIERIYAQVFDPQHRAISICSANAGEGCSSLAVALSQRNLLAGFSTLLIDLNLYRPTLTAVFHDQTIDLLGAQDNNDFQLLNAPQLVSPRGLNVALTGITKPTQRDHIMKLRRTGVLESYIELWKKHFDNIIFDTSPLNRINSQNIPAERVAAACDGSILVVLAGKTTEPSIALACDRLKRANAKLLGSVLNDRDNPPLAKELVREIDRLKPRFSRLATRLETWVCNNKLLSLEI